jgi:hypothetical protein
MPSDFWVWTFAYDVSGVARVDLKYRLDNDGTNPMTDDENETYAGGAGVGAWQTQSMTFRDFPKGNFFGDPSIDFSVLPDYIADEYYTYVTGLSEVLVDYYVEAEDSVGNVKRSPIQHVWVGPATGSPSHVIDGDLDSTSTLVASNGSFDLYADWDGEYLYVASQGVAQTSGWDHFILVGTDLSTPVSAPWAKSGQVADRTLYLGNEDSNNWCGWFDHMEAVLSTDVECASGAYLEGVVKLETHLGTPLPDEVYLSVGGYTSPDGGSLEDQAPAGNGNGNVEADEYAVFPLTTSGVDRPEGGSSTETLSIVATPNPFRGDITISFSLPRRANGTVEVYDAAGRKVATLYDGELHAGSNSLVWSGLTSHGKPASPGVYFLSLRAGSETLTRRAVLIR